MNVNQANEVLERVQAHAERGERARYHSHTHTPQLTTDGCATMGPAGTQQE